MYNNKRSRPKIVRQVEDKKPQAPLPDDGKSQATGKEAQGLNDKPAAKGLTFGDEDWIAFEDARSRLKEALGIDDDDFCIGIVRQLEKLTNWGHWSDQDDFNFVLSALKDAKPVDKYHAMLYVQMAVCQLVLMKQAEVLLKPVMFELPADFQVAIHNANYDTTRLDKQKIRVDDLPLRQSGERSVSRLMQTYVLLLQASIAYRKAHEQSVKVQPARQKTDKDPPARSSQKLNGSHQSAQGFTDSSKQMNSINVQKSNDHASS